MRKPSTESPTSSPTERTHTGEKYYKCGSTAKSFSDGSNFSRHQVPRTPRPYKCRDCGKSFSAGASLITHQRTTRARSPSGAPSAARASAEPQPHRACADPHTGEKPYVPQCGKSLTAVQPEHAPGNPQAKPYECKECAGESSLQLQPHQAHHGPPAREAHKCPDCGQRFSQSSRPSSTTGGTHTGEALPVRRVRPKASAAAPAWPRTAGPTWWEKPYKCGSAAKAQPELQPHFATRARTRSEKPYECRTCGRLQLELQPPEAPAGSTQAKPYKCGESRKGLQPALPAGGAPADTREAKPYKCLMCGKGFSRGLHPGHAPEPTWGTSPTAVPSAARASAGIRCSSSTSGSTRVRSPTSAPSAARASATAPTSSRISELTEALLTGQGRGHEGQGPGEGPATLPHAGCVFRGAVLAKACCRILTLLHPHSLGSVHIVIQSQTPRTAHSKGSSRKFGRFLWHFLTLLAPSLTDLCASVAPLIEQGDSSPCASGGQRGPHFREAPDPGPSAATVGLRSLHPGCEHPRPPALAEPAPASGSWVWISGQGGRASVLKSSA